MDWEFSRARNDHRIESTVINAKREEDKVVRRLNRSEGE